MSWDIRGGTLFEITRMEKLRAGRRWMIHLDGEPAFAMEASAISAFGLAEGVRVDRDCLIERALPYERRAARERALSMLDRRARTRGEIETDLRRRGYPVAAIADALTMLEAYRYVDDGRMARDIVEAEKGRLSRREISRRMRARGMEAGVVDEALAVCGDEDEAEAAVAEARRRMRGRDATPDAMHRVVEALMRKGFPCAAARRAVHIVAGDEDG